MPIAGKWQNDHESLEFFKDGSLEFIEGNEKMIGIWSFPEPGTVRMKIESQEGEFTEIADFTIQGDEFHYKLKNSEQPDVMKRVRK